MRTWTLEKIAAEVDKLEGWIAAEDPDSWPPIDEGDGLIYALWASAGFPPLPVERPEEGPLLYMLDLVAAEVWAESRG
jgi:hypothetical protein